MDILYGLLLVVFVGGVHSDTTGAVIDERVSALVQENILLKDLSKTFASQQQDIMDLIKTVASQQQDIADLKNTLASQQHTIVELKGEVTSQQQDIRELKRTVLSQQKTKKLLKDLLTSQQQDVTDDAAKAQTEEEQTSNTLLDRKRFVFDSHETVVFEATIATGGYIVQSHVHDRILFDDISLNIGDGYHYGNGTFIAPVAGIYIFSTSVMMHGANSQDPDIHVLIKKNGAEIAGAFANNQEEYQHTSVTAAVTLQSGDSVYVGVQRHDNITFYGDRLSSFMGFLFYQY